MRPTSRRPSDLQRLGGAGGGEEIPVHPFGGSEIYNLGGRLCRAVGTFRIDAPGTYLVRTNGDALGQPQVAIGTSIGPAIGRTVVLTVPAVLVLFSGARPWRWWLRSAGARPSSAAGHDLLDAIGRAGRVVR